VVVETMARWWCGGRSGKMVVETVASVKSLSLTEKKADYMRSGIVILVSIPHDGAMM